MSKGLEGIYAAQSSISSIVGTTLTYRGYKIDDLAENSSFEEVIYLLWYGKLPTRKELGDLKEALYKASEVPTNVFFAVKTFPFDAHPMSVLRSAVSMLSLYEESADLIEEGNNLKLAFSLQAKIATLVAGIMRIRQGKEPLSPRKDFTYAENFLYMMTGKEPSKLASEAMDKALILHADHEFNASTFSSRVTVATLSDMYSGITSAVGTLKGSLHGGANEAVMNMLLEIDSFERILPYLKNAFSEKKKIMGMGHRVYKDGDPRAFILKELSKKIGIEMGETKWFDMSQQIEEMVFSEKGLKPNVDFYSASMYHAMGIPSEYFTLLFAVSRTSGWIAHMLEQYSNNRLIRPRAEYVGEGLRPYLSIKKR